MSHTAWRICRAARAATAFDGEGARLYPGRWNVRDVPMVYTASSLSLATLEYFVHVEPQDLPGDLVCIRVEVPTRVRIERVRVDDLPAGWRAMPARAATRDLGTSWARSARTVGLLVPSAVTPSEDNLLINPRHPDLRKLTFGRAQPFEFDPRMWK